MRLHSLQPSHQPHTPQRPVCHLPQPPAPFLLPVTCTHATPTESIVTNQAGYLLPTSSPWAVQLCVSEITTLASASSLANRSTDSTHWTCKHRYYMICTCCYVHTCRVRPHPVFRLEGGDDDGAQSSLATIYQHTRSRHDELEKGDESRETKQTFLPARARLHSKIRCQCACVSWGTNGGVATMLGRIWRATDRYRFVPRLSRAASSPAEVPLTAEHYGVKRGDYAQVGTLGSCTKNGSFFTFS